MRSWTQYALTRLFGPIGGVILSIAIFFFAFSTILTGYFYGESNVKYLFNDSKILFPIRLTVLIIIILSACGSASLIWSLVDIGVGLTATINDSERVYDKTEPHYLEHVLLSQDE